MVPRIGSHAIPALGAAATNAVADEATNGRLSAANAAGGAAAGAVRGTSAPNAANAPKGTRNFSEAASHTQYRTVAWCRRSVHANPAAASANAVDCHRWFSRLAAFMTSSLSRAARLRPRADPRA